MIPTESELESSEEWRKRQFFRGHNARWLYLVFGAGLSLWWFTWTKGASVKEGAVIGGALSLALYVLWWAARKDQIRRSQDHFIWLYGYLTNKMIREEEEGQKAKAAGDIKKSNQHWREAANIKARVIQYQKSIRKTSNIEGTASTDFESDDLLLDPAFQDLKDQAKSAVSG